MRTKIVFSIITFLAIVAGTVVTPGRDARAQSTLEVPGPAQQNQPYIPPRQAPPPYWNSPAGSDNPNPNGNTIQLLPPGLFNMQPSQPQPAAPPPQSAQPYSPPNSAPITSQANPLPAPFR